MAQAIHGAQMKLIPNAAHLANIDAPEEFNRVVREFSKSL
jgi:pimeloyl-ACP methyl ester carboxylesterase